MNNDHLEHSLTSGQPVPHHTFHQRLAFLLQFLVFELALDVQLVQELVGFVLLEVHDSVKDLVDGVQDELTERPNVVLRFGLGPLLGLEIEEVFSPQFGHQFV